ncbi:MAG TPA: DUF1015 domain-containing protein [Clostridia bacterium]|nr:DUF1015 domain-containing protein [Clostridia bacterium]
MALIKSFRALRPVPELAHRVAAPPYDVVSAEEARLLVRDNPYSFLHVGRSEIDLDPALNPYDGQVYAKAAGNLQWLVQEGVLQQDEQDCLYIYRLVKEGRAQTGLVACCSIDDYLQGIIKKHEYTRADKELDRFRHVDACNAQTGAIFLTYRFREKIESMMTDWTRSRQPVYDFIADDEVGHMVWLIDAPPVIDSLVAQFRHVDYLYIADGHHRTAAAVKVGLLRREQNPSYTGEEEFNYFLGVLFPHRELRILDYNRVVRDLQGLTEETFLARVQEKFVADKTGTGKPYRPRQPHTFGMYLGGDWYRLKAREGTFDRTDPVKSLDVSILQNNLLEPVLEIEDQRTDPRIDFIGGIRGLEELEKRVDQEGGVAFALFPASIEELMSIADSDQVMPPKSTWFEPKLRSGLFVHSLE